MSSDSTNTSDKKTSSPEEKSDTSIGGFLSHSAIYAIGNIINRLGAFLLLPIYTNYLTLGEYGALEMFYLISAIISGFLAVGIAHATLRFYFEYDELKERHAVVSTNLATSFGITLIGALMVAPFYKEITQFAFDSNEYQLCLLVILVTMVFELSSQICLAYVRAIEYSVFFIIIAIAKLIVQVSINSYLVIVKGAGVEGVLIGNMITVFVGWLVLVVFTLYRCGFRFHKEKMISMLQYSYPFLLATAITIVGMNADRIFINQMISIEALGLFSLAAKFALLLEAIVTEPFNRSYGSYRFAIMKEEHAAETQAKIVRYLVALQSIVALGLALFTYDILVLMSDEAFLPAADLLPILLIATCIKTMNYTFQTGIYYAKQTGYIFWMSVLSAVVSVTATVGLIYVIGLWGACIAQVIRALAVGSATNMISQRYFKVKYSYFKMFSVFLLAAAFFGASLLLQDLNFWLAVAIKIVMMFVYIFALYFGPIFNSEERADIRNFIDEKLLSKLKSKPTTA